MLLNVAVLSLEQKNLSSFRFRCSSESHVLTNKDDPGDILAIRGQVLVCGFILLVEETEKVKELQAGLVFLQV